MARIASREIARHTANRQRLLRRVRDFAEVKAAGIISSSRDRGLDMLAVDPQVRHAG